MTPQGVILLGLEPKVGKTYCSILLIKALQQARLNPGFFKLVDTGKADLNKSDAARVARACRLQQDPSEMCPYVLKHPGPAYLAARKSKMLIATQTLSERYGWNFATHSHMVVEGSGEVITPLMFEPNQILLQEDVITRLKLSVIVVVKLTTAAVNIASLSVPYLKTNGINPVGIIVNGYNARSADHRDTLGMIERFTQTKIIATVAQGQQALNSRIPLPQLFVRPDPLAY